MKKVIFYFAITVLLAIHLQSCRSTQTCPAYSEADVEQIDDRA